MIITRQKDVRSNIKKYFDITYDGESHNLEKLNIIRSLKNGWNGNGAPSFSPSVIDKVETMINRLNIQPEIFLPHLVRYSLNMTIPAGIIWR